MIVFAQTANAEGLATDRVVEWNSLSQQLEGWAHETTGGLGGVLYFVNRFDDNDAGKEPVQGSLRYAIEKINRPVWIRFANGAKGTIVLKRPIRLRSDVTIDGRDAKITIANRINWSDFKRKQTPGFRAECEKKSSSVITPTLFVVQNQKNIIVTHLNLDRIGFNQSPWESSDPSMDKECLGDLISVGNRKRAANAALPVAAHNLWFNELTFQNCGDGCLDVTRPEPSGKQYVTISNSRFNQTDKSLLLGSNADSTDKTIQYGKYLQKFSLYGNVFDRASQRNPKVVNAVAHIYNNHYIQWRSYGVGFYNSKVFFEQNLVDPSRRALVLEATDSQGGGAYSYQNQVESGGLALPDMKGYLAYRARWVPVPNNVVSARSLGR